MEEVNEDMTKRLKQSDRGRRNMDEYEMCIYIYVNIKLNSMGSIIKNY